MIDGQIKQIKSGDYVYIKAGQKYSVKAISELHIIEVQMGKDISEEDIERFDWDWDK